MSGFRFIVLLTLLIASALTHLNSTNLSSRQDTLARGLEIWRKPGVIQNHAACATCHSPDGIELAAYNFTDPNLRRRALPHLGPQDTEQLIAYIHALRAKLNLKSLRDPINDRLLQPGNRILPGKTPAERDQAFGQELETKLPLLFNQQIQTINQAHRAEAQLLKLDVTNLPVGIPLNRLSEDLAHGNDHASIAQWLPEVPPNIPDQDQPRWYAAEDTYLQNPTQQNLNNLITLHNQLVNTSRLQGYAILSATKFKALLVWQDRLRHHTETKPQTLTPEVALFGNYNPIWEVGETIRQNMGHNAAYLGMDPENQTKKLAGPPLMDQLHTLRASWFWAGWLSDQGLFKTSHDDKTRLGMWMSQSLSEDGPYPIHNVFFNIRRQAVVSNNPDSWGETPARRHRLWDLAGLRSFQYQYRDIPQTKTHRDLYLKFTLNSMWMNLLLFEDSIKTTGEVWIKINSLAIASLMVKFIETYDPASTNRAEALLTRIKGLSESAKERF